MNVDAGVENEQSASAGVSITVCDNGPLIVRGAFRLQTTEREPIDLERSTIALCRCGRSTTKPFCDGSHAITVGRP